MSHNIVCFRCGESLAVLSLPISRQDECPHCQVYLHVCRMCRLYDASVPRQCREDDADDVVEKERVNFCDYFDPDENAFDSARKTAADTSEQALDALFGDGEISESSSDLSDAEKLFK